MMLMIPRVYQNSGGQPVDADFTPGAGDVEQMTRYNEELGKAGVLETLDGLHPPVSGARVHFGGGKTRVIDGPFTESKEILGGYWVINVESREDAIEWARRCPAADGDVIEIRQIFGSEDWPDDVTEAADSEVVREAIAQRRGQS